jgi:hypothetical protein
MFMAAVKAQDLQALSFVWGGKDGPAITLGTMDREAMEKREIIMICHLTHDKFRITGESPAPNDQRNLTVEITRTRTNETRSTTFLTTPGPGKRWYVVQPDLNPLKDFCRGQ